MRGVGRWRGGHFAFLILSHPTSATYTLQLCVR